MSETAAPRFRPHRMIRNLLGPVFGAACFLATLTGVIVLVVLLGSILYAALKGKPDNPWYAIVANLKELWGLLRTVALNRQSSDPAAAGYRVGIVGSLWLLGLVALLAIPVGVAAGVYLEEYAPPGRLRRIIQTNIANLAGVPSIVYGILGLALFVRAFGVKALALGPCLLAGALTLSLLILPIIVITTQEALRTVPGSLRQACAGVGCDPLADGLRPCASRGPSGHHDRYDPRSLAGHRRDRPAAHGGRGGRHSQASQGTARALHGDSGRDLQLRQRAGPNVPDHHGGGNRDLAYPLALDERRRHHDSQPVPTLSVRKPEISFGISHDELMSVTEPRVEPVTAPSSLAPPPGAEKPMVLTTRGLSVWYGAALALKDITIDIPRHKITAVIGPSGCGKSTLLRCFNRMNDLITGARMEGEIRFNGELISTPGTDAVSLRRRIGMVFQKPNPFPKSIYNNIAWGARINGYRGDMDDLVERSLRRAALWDEVKNKLHRSGLELSGGQQQRLCIARTLAVEPEVILMDEPCSALDPISTARVEDLMDDLKADFTIIIVTHNMQQARRVSDMTACLMLDETVAAEIQRTGILAEFSPTDLLFTNPKDKRTEAYITGRIG